MLALLLAAPQMATAGDPPHNEEGKWEFVPHAVFDRDGQQICRDDWRHGNGQRLCPLQSGGLHLFAVEGARILKSDAKTYYALEAAAVQEAVRQWKKARHVSTRDCLSLYRKRSLSGDTFPNGFNCLNDDGLAELVKKRNRLTFGSDIRWRTGGSVNPFKIRANLVSPMFPTEETKKIEELRNAFVRECVEQQRTAPNQENSKLIGIVYRAAQIEFWAMPAGRQLALEWKWVKDNCRRHQPYPEEIEKVQIILYARTSNTEKWKCGISQARLTVGDCGRIFRVEPDGQREDVSETVLPALTQIQ